MPNGCSLHIGVSRVSPTLPEVAIPLPAAENDANSMQMIAQKQDYQSEILIAEDATADNILNSIRKNTDSLKSGDIFLVSFSGHGRAHDGLEPQKENAWVTYDRIVDRRELHSVLSLFQKGVRIVGISDCCFSENILPARISFFRKVFGPSFVINTVPTTKVPARSSSKTRIAPGDPSRNRKLQATAIALSS